MAGTEEMGDANCCRVYPTADGAFQGVPPLELVVAALRQNFVSEKEKVVLLKVFSRCCLCSEPLYFQEYHALPAGQHMRPYLAPLALDLSTIVLIFSLLRFCC